MRADLARRLDRLEARRRPPVPPVDTPSEFDRMSDEALDQWFASYEPPADAAPGLSLADFEAMTDDQLDDFFADEWADPQENDRGPSRRR